MGWARGVITRAASDCLVAKGGRGGRNVWDAERADRIGREFGRRGARAGAGVGLASAAERRAKVARWRISRP